MKKVSIKKIGIGLVIIIIACIVWIVVDNKKPNELDAFAQCISESGATFYGAFWCPACNQQKEMFGGAEKFLPYQECSNPNQSQNKICSDAGIESYPTWKFPNQENYLPGVQSLESLAVLTSCELPGNSSTEQPQE